MDKVLHSSKSIMWATPQWFFDKYNAIYHFNTDVCAISTNAKCGHYYTPDVDGLQQQWGGVCWMNPPYGRNDSYKWVQKDFNEMQKGVVIVALLPVRTDTKWYHEFINNQPNVKVEFIKGRLKFGDSKDAAPFPSMVVVFGTD